ncbi:alpha/beta fold hydrolase [Streptomyces sp. NPDC001904]|uniref:alpha/beta fold hydrolase n=1 Tax=Streptomyces sp. NPDC001904 TaxID=3154531 RepID=UPI00332ECE92
MTDQASARAARAAEPYARTVRGSGPGLLLAHGAGGSVEANYGPVLPALAAARTTVGVDYPGTGATPRATGPLRLDDLADELVAAADTEGLDRFAVAGYSLGGPVAVRIAARHPGRVTALLLTATFGHPAPQLRLAAETWRTLAAAGDRDAFARFLLPYALSSRALHALTDAEAAAAVRELAATAPPGAGDHADLVTRADVRADLAGITAPTLVVVTTEDRLAPPPAQRELAASIPGAHVAEMATGHLPFAELPDAWGALMVEFLRATDVSGRAFRHS